MSRVFEVFFPEALASGFHKVLMPGLIQKHIRISDYGSSGYKVSYLTWDRCRALHCSQNVLISAERHGVVLKLTRYLPRRPLSMLETKVCSDPCLKTLRAFLAACPRISDTTTELAVETSS